VRDAARNLVAGLQNVVDIAITFVIGVLPMLLIVVGIPGLVLWFAYRSWKSRRPTKAEPLPSE
jgi:cytoskeletal protein RodZ